MSCTRMRAARALLVAACALTTCVAAVGCADRPAECAPSLAEAQKPLDAAGAYAIEARKAAAALVERALAAAAAQDARFGPLRNYDEAKKLCVEAAAAQRTATEAIAKAKANEARIQKRDADAQKALGTLDARLALARGLADSGVVDAEGTAALRKVVQAGADIRRDLDRARAEQRAAGFALDMAAFDGAADRAASVTDDVRKTTLALTEQVAARCRLTLGGDALAEATLRAHADWILLDVPGESARRIVVLRVDREKKTCAVVYDRAASGAGIETLEGDLLTWNIPGTIPHQVLVSFGKKSAWFLEGARFVRYPHERSAGFSKACAGHVTCSKPRVTSKTIEATCECDTGGTARMLPSDITKTGRYAWDGARVIAEP